MITIYLIMFIVSLFFRLLPILNGNFWFTFDNARDYLWVRDIVILHKPYLIGPWSSLKGVFFGPAWYYLLTIPFVIFQGDPTGGTLLVTLSLLFSSTIGFLFAYYTFQSTRLALLVAFFLLFSTNLIEYSFVPFFANMLPIVTIFLIICLYKVEDRPMVNMVFSMILLGLCFSFEPMYGLAASGGIFIYLFVLWRRQRVKLKYLMVGSVFFLIPFLPQIIFELRHEFMQTKAILSYAQGYNRSLEGYLPLRSRIVNRIELFAVTWRRTFGENWLTSGFFFGMAYMFFLGTDRLVSPSSRVNRLLLLIGCLLVGMFIVLVLYREEAKAWYVTGLPVLYALLMSLVFDRIMNVSIQSKYLSLLLLCIFFVVSVKPLSSIEQYRQKKLIPDPSIFANEEQVIDYIYHDANGKGFTVYTYTPGVYDYPYQYLFWWYAVKHYGYMPQTLAYLPNIPPEYVPNKSMYESRSPRRMSEIMYLIVEREPQYINRLESWYSTFASTVPLTRVTFPFGVFVEKRTPAI